MEISKNLIIQSSRTWFGFNPNLEKFQSYVTLWKKTLANTTIKILHTYAFRQVFIRRYYAMLKNKSRVFLMSSSWKQSKNLRQSSRKWRLPPFSPKQIFIKNQAESLLYPYGTSASCKKQKKLMSRLWDIQRQTDYGINTDGRTDGQWQTFLVYRWAGPFLA